MQLTESTTITIRFNDCDPLGIVWHGNYVQYFEDGREAFGEKYGLRYLDIAAEGFTVPLVNIQCDYKRPLRYGDKVVVHTTYIDDLAAKLRFEYVLTHAVTGEVVAKGSSVQVFLDKESSLLQLTLPPFFSNWKKTQGLL